MLRGALLLAVVFAGLGAITAAQSGSWRWPALLAVWAAFGVACSMVLTPTGRLIRRSAPAGERTAAFAAQFATDQFPIADTLEASMQSFGDSILRSIKDAVLVVNADTTIERAKKKADGWKALCAKYRPLVEAERAQVKAAS